MMQGATPDVRPLRRLRLDLFNMDVQDFSVEIPAIQLRYHTVNLANLGAESSLSPTYQECEPISVNQQSPPGGNRSCCCGCFRCVVAVCLHCEDFQVLI